MYDPAKLASDAEPEMNNADKAAELANKDQSAGSHLKEYTVNAVADQCVSGVAARRISRRHRKMQADWLYMFMPGCSIASGLQIGE
jgi:hypothetical protein